MNAAPMTFTEFRFYSPVLDINAVRLSCFDEHGGEYFMIIPDGSTAPGGYLKRRHEALNRISEAVLLGLDPGEVTAQ